MNVQCDRDNHGQFQPGHDIGEASRFRPGQLSANPKGRPWGVNKWTRKLRSRRYHRRELEDVLIDEYAPANQREAAVRLLLPYVEQMPPCSVNRMAVTQLLEDMDELPTAELRQIVVDPRLNKDRQAAAYQILVDRGDLKPKGPSGAISAFGSDLGSLLDSLQTRI